MEPTLAVVTELHAGGCTVRPLDGSLAHEAAYGPAVAGEVRIRPKQLVAIDHGPRGPEVVWRWMLGRVIAIDGATAQVARADVAPEDMTDGPLEGSWMELGAVRGDHVTPGRLVYFCSDERTRRVAAVAGDDAAVSHAISAGGWSDIIAHAYRTA